MTIEEYPKEFLRGIPNKDFISGGHVNANAFQFDDVGRQDGNKELSINWLDDAEAITLALSQRKENGKIQFSAGVARLDLDYVKLIFQSISVGIFSYERSALPDNQYHGNLLLGNCDKSTKQLIMNGLALAAGTNIIPQTNTE